MTMYRSRVQKRLVRPPAVAGAFYPSDPNQLRQDIKYYLETAQIPPMRGVRAVICPHAGYIYSGLIAAASYKVLQQLPRRPRTVYLLGPAHYLPVSGIALGDFSALRTPLGEVPVATEMVDLLAASGDPYYKDVQPHLPEHSLEVQLPFLQVTLGAEIRVVPMLFGRVDPRRATVPLLDLVRSDPNAMIVVSSDLSHYHSYDVARQLDQQFLNAVLANDTVQAARGEACGIYPILVLMGIARQLGWQPALLDRRNSGDTAGDKRQVVGYAAIAYAKNNHEQ